MDDFLLSLPREDSYYFSKIDRSRINVAFTVKKLNLFCRAARKINAFLIKRRVSLFNGIVCRLCYDKKIVRAVLKDTGIAILDFGVGEDLLLLAKRKKCRNFYLLAWNALDDDAVRLYKKYLPDSRIYSYSRQDSEKYGLNHFNDFYLIDYPVEKSEIVNDMFYLGTDKNRIQFLSDFASMIGDDYSFEFDVLLDKKSARPDGADGITYLSDYISFDEYIKKVNAARCLVDFNNHFNITFRTIESMVFGKKYITNNPEIVHMDFYHENNILVVNEKTTIGDVREFMGKELVPVPRSVLEKYDIYTAYDLFKSKVC
ncbi:MAG: hypothetical protein J5958_05290 [Clostridia bacterium]|nr:hypothetical protein [Clostridia bacterium]